MPPSAVYSTARSSVTPAQLYQGSYKSSGGVDVDDDKVDITQFDKHNGGGGGNLFIFLFVIFLYF